MAASNPRRSQIVATLTVLAAIALVVWWLGSRPDPTEDEVEPTAAPRDAPPALVEGGPTLDAGEARPTPAPDEDPAPAPPPSADTPARVEVTVMRGERPLRALVEIKGADDFRRSAHVDDMGRATFGVQAGTYEVGVPQYYGSGTFGFPEPREIQVAPGEDVTVAFDMPAGVPVHIQGVVGDEKTPVRGSLSLWEHRARPPPRYVDVTSIFQVSRDRKSWAGDLPPGQYTALMSGGRDHAQGWVDFSVARGEDVVLRIPLGNDGVRAVVEATKGGAPLAKQRFNLNRLGSTLKDSASTMLRTDEKGRATSRPLPAGTYLAWFWDQGQVKKVQIPAADGVVAIALQPAPSKVGALSGRLAFREQMQVRWVRSVILVPTDPARAGEAMRYLKTSGGGHFKATDVAEGTYRLWVPWSAYRRMSFREFWSDPIEIRADAPVEVRLELEAD